MLKKQLFSQLEASMPDIIHDIIDLIRIPSLSTDPFQLGNGLAFVLNKAKEFGLNAHITDDGSVCVAEVGSGSEAVGILTHVDVVDPLEHTLWSNPPFDGVFKNGRIYGRGALDNKGSVILCLHILKVLKQYEADMKKKIQLIIGTREETVWTDMEYYTKHYQLPDYGFSPDGDFPVQNKEKGYADVKLTFEPSTDKEGVIEITSLDAGHSLNTIPNEATAVLTPVTDEISAEELLSKLPAQDGLNLKVSGNSIKVTAIGISCHSSLPEQGKNAIYILADYLVSTSSLDFSINGNYRLLKFVQECLSNDPYGYKMGIMAESEYENGEFVHKTTVAPTKIASPNCSLFLNFRTRYGTARDQLNAIFFKHQNVYHYDDFSYLEYHDPLFVQKTKPFIGEMAKAYENILSEPCEFTLCYGTTYAKSMPNMVSFGPLLKGKEDVSHQVDEYVETDMLLTAGKVYLTFLDNICFSSVSYK